MNNLWRGPILFLKVFKIEFLLLLEAMAPIIIDLNQARNFNQQEVIKNPTIFRLVRFIIEMKVITKFEQVLHLNIIYMFNIV